MSLRYAVLGAGMQGTCAAYDLVKNGDAEQVFLCDVGFHSQTQANRVNNLTQTDKVKAVYLNVPDTEGLIRFFQREGITACLSCVPYHMNPHAALAAVEAGTHFNDLGGNTDIVKATLKHGTKAKRKKVSIVPDCGVAPGMINVLAKMLLKQYHCCDDPQVRMYCGGLPQNKNLPLGYKLLFSPGGLTNEYMGKAQLIRDGKLCEVDTLEEHEVLNIGGVELHARTTSGGTSTCPEELEGQVNLYQYKTLRYPGHWEAMKGLKDMGMFDEVMIEGKQTEYEEPTFREVFHELAKRSFDHPREPDILYLHIRLNDICQTDVSLTLIDKQDKKTGFTAMERTTAFGATIITIMQAKGQIRPGAHTPMSAVEDTSEYYAQLVNRGFKFVNWKTGQAI